MWCADSLDDDWPFGFFLCFLGFLGFLSWQQRDLAKSSFPNIQIADHLTYSKSFSICFTIILVRQKLNQSRNACMINLLIFGCCCYCLLHEVELQFALVGEVCITNVTIFMQLRDLFCIGLSSKHCPLVSLQTCGATSQIGSKRKGSV